MNDKYTRWKGNGEVLDVFAKHSIRREREYGCIMEQSIRIQVSVCIQTENGYPRSNSHSESGRKGRYIGRI